MDGTSQKIIDATMSLIRDKGYVATTTKDIARLAGVNECTLFRKFESKKDIVLQGVAQEKWRANITPAALRGNSPPDHEGAAGIYRFSDRIFSGDGKAGKDSAF